MRRTPRAASLVVALGLLAACGDDTATPADAGAGATTTAVAVGGSPASTAPATTNPSTPAPGPARDVPAALDFAAPLVGGGELDLRQYAGSTVALWFWAPT